MSEPVTLIEIAAALSVSKRTAERRAEKEGWGYEEKAVRGGKQRFYSTAALPKSIQRKVLAKRAIIAVKKVNPEISDFVVVLDGEVFEVRKIK